MDERTNEVLRWIDGRFDEMLERPRAWASSPESLEFQLLTLLEVRGMLLGRAPTGPRDGEWRRLFALSQEGDSYLSERFRDADVDEALFLEALRPAVNAVRRRQDTPAD
jgi:hypothetical protein